jgi:hypothetical protein
VDLIIVFCREGELRKAKPVGQAATEKKEENLLEELD